MSGLIFKKVAVLPETFEANTIYMIKEDEDFRLYVSSSDGSKVYPNVAKANTADFTRYDLPVAVTTGNLDLSQNQVFKIDLTTAGVRTINFVNPPDRAMVVVIETIGSVGTLQFPPSMKITEDSDQTVGESRSIITLFWDGSAMYFMSNGRVAAQ